MGRGPTPHQGSFSLPFLSLCAIILEANFVLLLHSYIGIWRVPIGESGVLDFFLEKVQDQGLGDPVVQTLRVIGNSCVDCSTFLSLRPITLRWIIALSLDGHGGTEPPAGLSPTAWNTR